MKDYNTYHHPLSGRYPSDAMQFIFSPQRKIEYWRTFWAALAEAQMELGLGITQEQVDQLWNNISNIDHELAAKEERIRKHDVMAHVHTFGAAAPIAKGIIHMGATSMFVNDNGDLMQIRDGLRLLIPKIEICIANLAKFAEEHKALTTLGFTHGQPAQPTTVGKRACMWIQDINMVLEEIKHLESTMKFRGLKGATGTQASFLKLFNGDYEKVDQLEARVMELASCTTETNSIYEITGQTYSRQFDAKAIFTIASIATVFKKFTVDIRLLAKDKEIEEPFAKDQIGSSAMAFKRNPMLSERGGALSRTLIEKVPSMMYMASEQWFERTLDDSAQRRITIPDAFLTADSILETLAKITNGLVVYPKMIERNLNVELPFMLTENIMMKAVELGGNRQELHEVIRVHSHTASTRYKVEGLSNNLLELLKNDPALEVLNDEDWKELENPNNLTGCATRQTEKFLKQFDHLKHLAGTGGGAVKV